MRPFDYWASGAGLSQVTPHDLPLPEGADFPRFLAELIGSRKVLEFGCGPGRIAAFIAPEQYLGVDICALAIERANEAQPKHIFAVIGEGESLAAADVVLCHTVLLHVPDDQLLKAIEAFNADAVIVSEILGRKWRREGDPPVFNREAIDYVLAFGKLGYALAAHVERPYPYYRDTNLTVMEFRRDRAKTAAAQNEAAATESPNDRSVLDAPGAARPRRAKGGRSDS